MNPEPKNMDVLQNLEAIVVTVFRDHPEMTDRVAARAYEAAFEHYRAEVRGHAPKPCTLTGIEREVFNGLIAICDWRLGRSKGGIESDEIPNPLSVTEIVDCLRQLRKSVERHTRSGGSQGYLVFVAAFVH